MNMANNHDYPEGSDNSKAPWNKKEESFTYWYELNVNLIKRGKITIDNVECDEYGEPCLSKDDIYDEIVSQKNDIIDLLMLLQDLLKEKIETEEDIDKKSTYKKAYNDSRDYYIDLIELEEYHEL